MWVLLGSGAQQRRSCLRAIDKVSQVSPVCASVCGSETVWLASHVCMYVPQCTYPTHSFFSSLCTDVRSVMRVPV